MSTALVRECLESEQAKLDTLLHGNGTESGAELMRRMQDIMTDKVGIFRTANCSSPPWKDYQGLLVRSRRIGLRTRRPGANPELVTAYRVQKMPQAGPLWPTVPSSAPRAVAPISARTIRAATMPIGSNAPW